MQEQLHQFHLHTWPPSAHVEQSDSDMARGAQSVGAHEPTHAGSHDRDAS